MSDRTIPRTLLSGNRLALVALSAAYAVLSIFFPALQSSSNLSTVALQASVPVILACAMTFVMSSGHIDLSIGSVVSLSATVFALTLQAGASAIAAMLSATVAAVTVGIVTGVSISVLRLPAILSTLGMMSVARGAALLISDGATIRVDPAQLELVGLGIDGASALSIGSAAVVLLGSVMVDRTKVGLQLRALGSSPRIAELLAIDSARFQIVVFALSAASCALCGIIVATRLSSVAPGLGTGYELDAIAACVLGARASGAGSPSPFGAALGAFVLVAIRNAMIVANVPVFWHHVLLGVLVILGALAMVRIRSRRRRSDPRSGGSARNA